METKENKDNILAQSNIHGEGGGRLDGQGGEIGNWPIWIGMIKRSRRK